MAYIELWKDFNPFAMPLQISFAAKSHNTKSPQQASSQNEYDTHLWEAKSSYELVFPIIYPM